MLKSNIYTKNLNIHTDFPKDILVDIFRPFLFYYYIKYYDIKGTNKINNYAFILAVKLKVFYLYNTGFGRRQLKITKHFNKVIKKEYKFNTEHISFYKINCYLYGETEINQLINNIDDEETMSEQETIGEEDTISENDDVDSIS